MPIPGNDNGISEVSRLIKRVGIRMYLGMLRHAGIQPGTEKAEAQAFLINRRYDIAAKATEQYQKMDKVLSQPRVLPKAALEEVARILTERGGDIDQVIDEELYSFNEWAERCPTWLG